MLETTANRPGSLRLWAGTSVSIAALALAGCGGGAEDATKVAATTETAQSAQTAKIEQALETDDAADDRAGGDDADDRDDRDDDSRACSRRVNNTFKKLLRCVTLRGVRSHQAKLQAIANANGGTRVSGTSGYDISAAYAEHVFRKAGYRVTRQEFQFVRFNALSPAVITQVAPAPGGAIENIVMSYSGSGDVTAAVTALPGPAVDPTPGCEDADFAAFPAGNIALISRGACTFAIKATNAANRGAVAVVIYNNIPGPLNGTLGDTFTLNIGVTGVTQAIGEQLAATPGLVLRLQTDNLRVPATSSNILAESKRGNPGNVVMVGAHLDSVEAGPGIQDNGSGSAAILETAVQMSKVRPRNKVRFALWGAEESGLVGSTRYVTGLLPAELDKIALYLNFDMIGSPNHVFFIYDGDDSDAVGAGPGPAGSAEIEKVFETFYAAPRHPVQGHRLHRPLRLRPVHCRRHPGRWTVHRCRGHQDRGRSGAVGRNGRPGLRPVLPPSLRHVCQCQSQGARHQRRRSRLFDAAVCDEQEHRRPTSLARHE